MSAVLTQAREGSADNTECVRLNAVSNREAVETAAAPSLF